LKSLWLCAALSLGNAWAQAPAGALATVNGVALSQAAFDKLVQSTVAQGQTDSPQLRQNLKTELIARELLLQEAARRGLDKREGVPQALATLQQNFMIDLLVNDHLAQNPISEADIRAEYARQSGLLKGAEQFQLRHIVTPSEAEGKAVIAALKSGKDFATLAKEKSLDASKEQGGQLGWLLSNDIVPPVLQAITGLKKGALTPTPIDVGGRWHVVQVEDKRPFQVPKFEESLPQLRQALVQQRRLQLLEQLAKSANIQQ
jgi:peptidyl-prolyl cis-trans isomerase C